MMSEIIKKIPVLGNLARNAYSRYKSVRGRYRLKRLSKRRPLRIVVGASGVFDDGWIPTDIEYLNLLNQEHWEEYFSKDSIDAILAEHVWEHLTLNEGLVAARRCFQYLKPGGYLRVAVPDGFHPDPEYIEWVKVDGVGPRADDHKVLYNFETLSGIFKRAGFEVELLEYFDSKGEFHYADWDVAGGTIHRSKRFDERNKNGELKYTSIILDARKNP